MKLIFESWKKFLKESEKSFFPWLGELEAIPYPDIRDVKKLPGWRRIGRGAFRGVFLPPGEEDYVVKIIRRGARTEEEEDEG